MKFFRVQVRDHRFRRATAVVEFAVTMPVFAMLLFATIETTSMVFLQQSLEICAYESVRVALVPGANAANVTAAANNILTVRGVDSATVTVVPNNFDTQPYGTEITVTVAAPCTANSTIAPWFYGGKTLTGTVTMMKEY